MLFVRSFVIIIMVTAAAVAAPISVPNFSFEFPPVERNEENPFGALPFLDDWDETAVGGADEFDQNTGVFLNTDPMSLDHITNSHLDRLAFISSLIGNDLRQTVAANYVVGESYKLTVAIGTSATFSVGAAEELEVALFYFDGGVEQVIVSETITGADVGTTLLVDLDIVLPAVGAGDAWANEPIGVLIRPSTTDADESGVTGGEGFWNIDHVRLDSLDAGIPAASTWGLIVMGLVVATAGTVILRRRLAMA